METHRTEWTALARRSQRGTALVMGVFLGMLAAGLTFSGAFLMQLNRAGVESGFILSGQSGQFARCGITEALNWFRLQPTQPVLDFDPQSIVSTPASAGETQDANIGLVRDFQIDGSYWGRYEVWKPWSADPDLQRRAWRENMMVADTSAMHRMTPGSAWKIKCIGYVYRRTDPDKAFDRFPNQVLGSEILEVEIVRVGLTPSGSSALSIRAGDRLDLQAGSRVSGGGDGAAITYSKTSEKPVISLVDVIVEGDPVLAPVPEYDDSLNAVFGTDHAGLQAVADRVITRAEDFPSPIPANGIVFCALGTLTLSETRPLSGFGVVVHLGDLRLEAGAGSGFRGLLYVDGDLEVAGPADIAGTVIVTGQVTVEGGSGPATLRYDPDALDRLKSVFGQYRFSTPVRRLRPTE